MTVTKLRGNFISEWFGFRTFPLVYGGEEAARTQTDCRCPFLTASSGVTRDCVKSAASSGVCTINNGSNGVRQDWLVCPFRALDPTLIDDVVQRLFASSPGEPVLVVPAPTIADPHVRREVLKQVADRKLAIVYLQSKLGGEVSVRGTERSPELSFDMTLVELSEADNGLIGVGRFGVLEIQTMDFHGSYRRAVKNLKDSLRLHRADFPNALQSNQRWLSEGVEGPNVANVFKRTFYQMMLKFRLGLHPSSVGTALAIPQAVWDSWQPHLGRPNLVLRDDGQYTLTHPNAGSAVHDAWIYVFDVDADSTVHPSPIVVNRRILTNAASIARYALDEVPSRAFVEAGADDALIAAIQRRLAVWWPDLAIAETALRTQDKG